LENCPGALPSVPIEGPAELKTRSAGVRLNRPRM
jgi:hypothetical protein